MEKEQQTLLSLADMMIEIYYAESGVMRTIKNKDRGMEQTHQIDMAKLYLFEATETTQRKAKEIIGNLAKGDAQTNLLKSVHRLCRYDQLPDVIELKNRIADAIIKENKYCF